MKELKRKVALVAHEGQPDAPHWVYAQLGEIGVSLLVKQCMTVDELIDAAADADVVWLLSGLNPLTAESLSSLTKCRAI